MRNMQKSIFDEGKFFELIKTSDANDERGHNPSKDFRTADEHFGSMLGMEPQNLKSPEEDTFIILGRAHNTH